MRMNRPLLVTLAWLLCGTAYAAESPTLRLCTGKAGNNYHRVGKALATKLEGRVQVKLVETAGSWENLESIDQARRRCDAVIAQDDAYALYQYEHPDTKLTIDRMATLYPEHVHLLCNKKAGVANLRALNARKHKVLVNRYGSGTYISWSLFGRLNPAYARIPSSEVNVDEGLLKIADGVQAQCMVFVSGLGGRTLATADRSFGDRLTLVAATDASLQRKVGRDKRVVYHDSVIPKGTYPNLAADAVKTQRIDAVFFASPEWKARHPAAARTLATVLVELIPDLKAQLNLK
jgi:uncharacterized protein